MNEDTATAHNVVFPAGRGRLVTTVAFRIVLGSTTSGEGLLENP